MTSVLLRRLMRTLARLTAASGVVALAACNSTGPADAGPLPDLPADTDYPLAILADTPTAGSPTVPITLTNGGGVELGYNLCIDGHIERYSARGWMAIGSDPVPCPSMLLVLPPGASAQSSVAIPTGSPTGSYRVRVDARVLRTDAPVIRRSNVFAVTR